MGSLSGNYAHLIAKIDEFIRKYYLNKIIRGSIYLAASLFASYVLVTIAEYYGNFSPLVRALLFYSFIGLNLTILIRWIVLPLLAYMHLGKTISYEQASTIIGDHFSDVKDKLINTLQLKRLADNSSERFELIEASINQKIADLRPIPFASAIMIGENRRYLKYAIAPLTVIVLIAVTVPSIFSEGTERLLNHNKRFVKKAPFQFVVLNKALVATQGDDYELQVKLMGNEIPQEIYLEDGTNTFKLDKESIIRFNYTFKNIQENKKIRLVGGEFASDEYTIGVKLKPVLLDFDVYLQYPAYLGKANETVSNTGDMTVPQGTRINWRFRAKNTDDIIMGIGNQRLKIKQAENAMFNYSYRAMENVNYFLRPTNNEVVSRDSVGYQLNIIPDLSPAIEVTERADSTNQRKLTFVGQSSDDHGLSKLEFHYSVITPNGAGKDNVVPVELMFDAQNRTQGTFYNIWDLTEAGIKAGQQVEYYFEIFDNDGVNGSKSTRTPLKTINLPSTNELEQRIAESEQATKEKMQDAIKQASQIQSEVRRMMDNLISRKGGSLTFDEKKQLENLLKKYEDLQNMMKEIQEDHQQNIEDRQQLGEQNQKMLEEAKMINELMKESVLDEKLKELMENIQKLLKNDNNNVRPQVQQNLNRMQQNNTDKVRDLKRYEQLMKRLELRKEVEDLIKKLEEMAEEQQKLSDESLKQAPKEQDAKEQQNAKQPEAKPQDAKEQQNAKQQDAKEQQNAKQPEAKPQDAREQQNAKQQDAKEQQDTKAQDAKEQQNVKQQEQRPQSAQEQLSAREQAERLAELKKDQERLNSEFEKMQEEMKALEEKDEAMKQDDFQNPEKEQEEVKEQQQQSSRNLERKDMKKASENQRNAAQQMRRMAQQMQQEQEESEQEENQVNAQALREILQNLLRSSFSQEDLFQSLRAPNASSSPNYNALAQKQKDVKDNIGMIADSLHSLSEKVPQIKSVINKEINAINQHIDMALTNLPERRTIEARSSQQYAMTSMNNLAVMLADALNNMQMSMNQSSKAGQGKKPSLQQISQRQQQLMQNMQRAREEMQRQQQQQQGQQGQQGEGQQGQQGEGQQGQGQEGQGQQGQGQRGGRGGQGSQSEQMARMAREQQLIRQALQEFNREENSDGQNSLGDLDEIIRDMERNETDLLNKRLQQEAMFRQQDIVTKLLEAEKAERERETDPKRESKAGKEQIQDNRIVLEEFQKIKARQTELLKNLPPALNDFYKTKITDYYKLLNTGN